MESEINLFYIDLQTSQDYFDTLKVNKQNTKHGQVTGTRRWLVRTVGKMFIAKPDDLNLI